ncbi:MAG: hypothetical protein H6811_01745 [Phycisphaeraceae bacterium]|nr:hypothetical protein [Phycisphaeraceae bacterium]
MATSIRERPSVGVHAGRRDHRRGYHCGRRIAAIEADDTGTSLYAWEYDGIGRLVQEAYQRDDDVNDLDNAYVDQFTFDGAGNRLALDRDTDPILDVDGDGFLVFDPQDFAAEREIDYIYDDNDRLTSETLNLPDTADDRHTA